MLIKRYSYQMYRILRVNYPIINLIQFINISTIEGINEAQIFLINRLQVLYE
jgi:hypothetical protein